MKKGLIYIIAATILFSSMETVLKTMAGDFNSIQLNLIRFTIGGLLLLPFAIGSLRGKKTQLGFGDLLFFLLTGLVGITLSMTLYQFSILLSKASLVAVLFSCNPVFVILFAALILHERLKRYMVFTLILSLAGLSCILNPAHLASADFRGGILALLAALVFALYTVIGKLRSVRYGGIATTSFSFLAAGLEMLIMTGISHIPLVAGNLDLRGLSMFSRIPLIAGIHGSNVLALLYVSICVSGLGYTFYFLAAEETSAIMSSLVFYIKPALASFFAFIFLHEAVSLLTIIGILLIMGGSAVSFISSVKRAGHNQPVNGDHLPRH